jgi:hypothetical protein
MAKYLGPSSQNLAHRLNCVALFVCPYLPALVSLPFDPITGAYLCIGAVLFTLAAPKPECDHGGNPSARN